MKPEPRGTISLITFLRDLFSGYEAVPCMRRAWIPAGSAYTVESKSRATIAIIVINVAAYLFTSYRNLFLSIDNNVLWQYGYVPGYISISISEAITRIITSMFLHADPLHIFFNMYFLYFFGKAVEGVLGSGRYLILYIASGFWAAFLHTVSIGFQGVSSISIPAVGASGAISGVLGSYLMLYPTTPLSMCFFYIIFPVCGTFRASTFLLFWFAIQVIYGYLRLGGIAFFAHAGGFIAGIALTWILGGDIVRRYKTPMPWLGIGSWGLSMRGEGLGGVQKAALAVLLISILAMAGYSYFQGALVDRSQLTYLIDVKIRETPAGQIYSMSQATLTLSKDRSDFSMSPIGDDLSRILINRFIASKLLINPSMAEKTGFISTAYNVVVQGVRVPFAISANISYDKNGVMIFSEGSSRTYSIICDIGCREGDEIIYPWFTLRSYGPISVAELSQLPLLLSAIMLLLSLYVVLAKDRDLSIDL
jgi:membrane associated rhomboid family serine protease